MKDVRSLGIGLYENTGCDQNPLECCLENGVQVAHHSSCIRVTQLCKCLSGWSSEVRASLQEAMDESVVMVTPFCSQCQYFISFKDSFDDVTQLKNTQKYMRGKTPVI